MAEKPKRFDHVRRLALIAQGAILTGLLALIIVGCYFFSQGADLEKVSRVWIGVTILAGGIMLTGLAIFAASVVELVLKIEANSYRMYDVLRDVHALIGRNNANLQTIAENVQLSDMARALTHRTKERAALRLAINEEIIKGDYEAAYALVELLESRHGYRNEAARLRAEVDLSQDREKYDKIHEAINRVQARLENHDWDAARREMDRLLAEQPDNPDVRDLPKQFAKMRNEHKRRLLKEWDDSVRRNEVDRGIAILKELDQYLTTNEAAALQESARGVFQAKLHNLGVQFSLAVTEHNWNEALDVGRQIMAEFPNSRMAQEVNERIHVLTKRALDNAREPAAASQA